MWDGFVELIRIGILGAAHLCGGSLGAGIISVSVALRLALLPLTLRLAREARMQQVRLSALKPRVEALQRRHGHDPARLLRETQALYRANGIRLLTPIRLVGTLIQIPLLGGLFAAVRAGLGARVRFLWIRNLAAPDVPLTALVTMLAAALMVWGSRGQAPTSPASASVLLLIGVGGTLFFLWSASSAVALSFGAGSLVSGLQTWLLIRDTKRERTT